jgi:hypothetical protein
MRVERKQWMKGKGALFSFEEFSWGEMGEEMNGGGHVFMYSMARCVSTI